METTLYQIEFRDGSTFRVFCANKTQKKKLLADYSRIKHLTKSITELSNGIHTYPEWVNIVAEKAAEVALSLATKETERIVLAKQNRITEITLL